MPATIHERGQINRRVALDVAADVQSQRQDSPVLLKRKQDTPVAVLLAKDLVVAIPPSWPGPGAERNPFQLAKIGPAGHVQHVVAG